VSLPLQRSAFELVNPAMERVVEPGDFEIQVGASSEDIRLKTTLQYQQ
jgi:beta-glucosidase